MPGRKAQATIIGDSDARLKSALLLKRLAWCWQNKA